MESRRIFSWTVLACAALLGLSFAVSFNHSRWVTPASGSSLQQLIADGGGPAPPYPPQKFGDLIADGGGPAPPYPPIAVFGALIADGGGPAPPYPPSNC